MVSTLALVFEQATALWIFGAAGASLFLGFAVYHRLRMRRADEREFDLRVTIERKSFSEERYRELFENAADAVLVTDLDGNITELNRKAETLIGYEGEQARQLNLRALLPDGDAGQRALRRWLDGQTDASEPIEIRNRSGEAIPVEVNTRVIEEGGHPKAMQAIARDVRERVALERQLRQSQKMEAIGQLAGGVAHDFNNLLTVIRGNSAMVLDALPIGNELREDVEQIDQAADRASVLTRQLLAFSRQEVVQPRVLELNEVLRGVQSMLQRLIGGEYTIRTTLTRDGVFIMADPGQIEQILLNLVVNARDAMPAGGTIGIETSLADDKVRLIVSDTGTGMDTETQARIFEPFFTTKEVGKGTGLGLSTVFGIVQQTGGQIECVSAPNAGTTFTILLPKVAPLEAPKPEASPEPNRFGGTETILLAEDDDAVRDVATRVLRRAGYRVIEARNGEEALNLAHDHPYHIDLLLSDVVMPGMDGLVLSARLSITRSSTQVILMSGYTDDEILRRGLHQPGCAYLQKPFTPESLSRKVRGVLDGASVDTVEAIA